MIPYDYRTFENDLIDRRQPSGARHRSRGIDDAVRRILTQKFELGLFEHPFTDRTHIAEVGSAGAPRGRPPGRRRVAGAAQERRRAAAVARPRRSTSPARNADDLGNQAGGWTVTWQGALGQHRSRARTSIRSGIEQVAPGATVTYSRDASAPIDRLRRRRRRRRRDAVRRGQTATSATAAQTLTLSAADRTAIDSVCAAMKCVVLVVSGRPMIVADQLREGRTRSSPRGCPAARARAWPTCCSATSRSPAGCR